MFTRCIQCFCFPKFLKQLEQTLELLVTGLAHYNHITLSVFGYEYGLALLWKFTTLGLPPLFCVTKMDHSEMAL